MATTKKLNRTTIRSRETLRLAEVALEAGVSYSTASGWRKRPGFPQPVRTQGRQVWFDRAEVDAFLRAHQLGVNYEAGRPGSRRGRPRSEHNTAAAKAYATGREVASRGRSPWLMLPAAGAGVLVGLLVGIAL